MYRETSDETNKAFQAQFTALTQRIENIESFHTMLLEKEAQMQAFIERVNENLNTLNQKEAVIMEEIKRNGSEKLEVILKQTLANFLQEKKEADEVALKEQTIALEASAPTTETEIEMTKERVDSEEESILFERTEEGEAKTLEKIPEDEFEDVSKVSAEDVSRESAEDRQEIPSDHEQVEQDTVTELDKENNFVVGMLEAAALEQTDIDEEEQEGKEEEDGSDRAKSDSEDADQYDEEDEENKKKE